MSPHRSLPSRYQDPTRNHIVGSALVATALILGACSSNSNTIEIPTSDSPVTSIDSTGGSSSTDGSTIVSDTAGTTSVPAAPSEDSASGGPGAVSDGYVSAIDRSTAALETAGGGTYGKEEFGMTMEQLTKRIGGVEEQIGVCMAEAGFEYIPVDFSTVRKAMTSDKSAPGLSPAEYLAQYGHGITTQPDKPIVRIGLGDKNRKIFDSLRPEDQTAYLHILLGQHENATFAFGLESEKFSRTGGCTRTAIERSFTPTEMETTYFNPADAYILADPRSQAALVDYAACMADAGYSYQHPDDVDFDLQVRYDSITQGRDSAEVTGSGLEALTRLQSEEIAVTAVNQRCETTVLEPVLDRVQADLFGR